MRKGFVSYFSCEREKIKTKINCKSKEKANSLIQTYVGLHSKRKLKSFNLGMNL